MDALNTYDQSKRFNDQLRRVAEKSDLILTPGSLLEIELKKLNKNTTRISHGCDDRYSKFLKRKKFLKDFSFLKKPIAIYVGTLANWVDYDLLIKCVSDNVKIPFVFIGYIHSLAPTDKIKELMSFSNVFHLGYKKFEVLPDYINNSDLCIVPYNEKMPYTIFSPN